MAKFGGVFVEMLVVEAVQHDFLDHPPKATASGTRRAMGRLGPGSDPEAPQQEDAVQEHRSRQEQASGEVRQSHAAPLVLGDWTPADSDKKPDTMEVKALHEISAKTTNNHPGVFLLFPGKEAAAEPKLVNKGEGHWVLMIMQEVTADGKKATIGVGLTLVGSSPSA